MPARPTSLSPANPPVKGTSEVTRAAARSRLRLPLGHRQVRSSARRRNNPVARQVNVMMIAVPWRRMRDDDPLAFEVCVPDMP